MFRKTDKLRLAYIKGSKTFEDQLVGSTPQKHGKSDLAFLFHVFAIEPMRDGRTFVEELKERGYDIETIYFEIERKQDEKEN